jgi:LemA protein
MSVELNKLIKRGFTEKEANKVIEKAIKFWHETKGQIDKDTLIKSALELDIPEEFIERAIEEIRIEREKKKFSSLIRKTVLLIVGLFAFIFAITFVISYNSLNKVETKVNQTYIQVEPILKKRYEFTSNAIKICLEPKDKMFITVEEIRYRFVKVTTHREKIEAYNRSEDIIRQFISEFNISRLWCEQEYSDFRNKIANTEAKLLVEGEIYNKSVTEYNKIATTFPVSVFRRLLKFDERKPHLILK